MSETAISTHRGLRAVCATCGAVASMISVATHGRSGPLDDMRISRQSWTVMYSCREHYEAVSDALCDEFGMASNIYEPNELALAVSERSRAVLMAEQAAKEQSA